MSEVPITEAPAAAPAAEPEHAAPAPVTDVAETAPPAADAADEVVEEPRKMTYGTQFDAAIKYKDEGGALFKERAGGGGRGCMQCRLCAL
jgi:hypothetical protein